jgi:hypothetical protein
MRHKRGPLRVRRHEVTQPLDKPYRFIPLTQGKNAIVDVEDFDRLSQWNWRAQWDRSARGFYAVVLVENTLLLMHRLILKCKKGELADHENHDGLDNRKINLRKCTRSQNMYNRRRGQNNTSGYKGVYWHESVRKWGAQITTNGKHKFLGLFQSKEEAAHAYDDAARKYHKKFAFLNLP